MDAALVALVWQRANATCEYCLLPQAISSIPFEIDHVIAQKHGGPTEPDNLALTCFYCEQLQGPEHRRNRPGVGENRSSRMGVVRSARHSRDRCSTACWLRPPADATGTLIQGTQD
ncbi:uncharacterized protein SOCE26_078160 [Sorangium cellulosum]|uniref:HNH nuclease domain-containing protein n=1 Tax=Sorangium cellulosum TaxID=56 RepID=A0A2L0F476_SORCE|nr:uncharacterized protein SOCE26_078160 [Sorangium cellulosum]